MSRKYCPLEFKSSSGLSLGRMVTFKTKEQRALHFQEKSKESIYSFIRFQDSRTKPQADQSEHHNSSSWKMFISDSFFKFIYLYDLNVLKGILKCSYPRSRRTTFLLNELCHAHEPGKFSPKNSASLSSESPWYESQACL